MMPMLKGRWIRFSMRTLFALVTVACVALGVRFGWRPSWIAARHDFLARQNTEWADAPPEIRRAPAIGQPHIAPRAGYEVRFLLWFYGQTPQPSVRIPIRTGRLGRGSPLATDAHVQKAAELFPEASIYAVPVLTYPDLPRRSVERFQDLK
jgi:hypothetical protein